MGLVELLEKAISKQKQNEHSKAALLAITDRQAQKLVHKYIDDLELWNRFWQFMADQSDEGASYEYVANSYGVLELAWQKQIEHRSSKMESQFRIQRRLEGV